MPALLYKDGETHFPCLRSFAIAVERKVVYATPMFVTAQHSNLSTTYTCIPRIRSAKHEAWSYRRLRSVSLPLKTSRSTAILKRYCATVTYYGGGGEGRER